MIPLSVIDALILKNQQELKEADYVMDEFTDADRIKLLLWELEELKKEATLIQTQPTIPISVVDAAIKSLDKYCEYWKNKKESTIKGKMEDVIREAVIPILEDLKKEAIPVQDYEQRIRDRIAELEDMWFTGPNVMKDIEYRDVKLEELRKLVEN